MSSKAFRGKSFSKAELESLLEIIEEVLPIGMNEWEAVLDRHLTRYPDMDRTKESIKRKFASLYNSKKPTGDPSCPPTVRSAKRIYNMIKEKMDISDGEGGLGDEDEDEVEDDEDDEAIRMMSESQESRETPIDSNNQRSTSNNAGSGGNELDIQNVAIKPYRMVPSSSVKRRAGAATGAESDSFTEFMKAMILRNEKDLELQAARHRESMELMERKEKLEEMRSERAQKSAEMQEKWMQMMMMQMMHQNTASAASKKQKVSLELPDDSDSD